MKKNLYILAVAGLFLQGCNAQTVKDPHGSPSQRIRSLLWRAARRF